MMMLFPHSKMKRLLNRDGVIGADAIGGRRNPLPHILR
jgi:hypothetical protein